METQQAINTNIDANTFAGHYVVYARKSTDDAEIQKNSLSFQKQEGTRFARAHQLPIAELTIPGFVTDGIIAEKHSAFKTSAGFEITAEGSLVLPIERPKFQQLVYHLNRRTFAGVIILSWDRACRNDSDEVALKRLIRAGVDVRFVTTTYEQSSAGALHMDVDGMFAKHHSRVTREKVQATTKQLRNRGICTYRAPVGYLNQRSSAHKPIDPVRAPRITEFFDLYATGDWTLAALTRHANDTGFTMPAMRRKRTTEELLADEHDGANLLQKVERPLTQTTLHKILQNPFYAGYIRGVEPGSWIKSECHEPLVREGVFQQVQTNLHRRKVSQHYDVSLSLPYRKLARCALCDRVYTPYTKKKGIYFGARCPADCPNQFRSFPLLWLERKIERYLSGLRFTDTELQEIETRLATAETEQQTAVHDKAKAHARRQTRLRQDLRYLEDNKLMLLRTGTYTVDGLQTEMERLQSELTEQPVRPPEATPTSEFMDKLASVSELLNTATNLFQTAKTPIREQITRSVVSELRVSENTLQIKAHSAWQPLEERFVSQCDPKSHISELLDALTRIISQVV